MIACVACGTESPEGFRFCPACATPLGTPVAAPLPEERKVVTALFCDLVGFTATSEGADPAAAAAYAGAAGRWERFGVVPEHAFALLGQGRCLVGLDRPAEAAPVLRQAREIFDRLRAVPALAEIDALLEPSS